MRSAVCKAFAASLMATATLTGIAAAAGAAGGGYGPSAAVPGGVPGGFTSVAVARTFTPRGGVLRAKVDGLTVMTKVASGDLSGGTQVAITRANVHSVQKGLTGPLRRDHVVFAAGLVLDSKGRARSARHPMAITVTGASLHVGDEIVVYRAGHFVVVGRVTVKGRFTIKTRGVTEFAVVAPKA